MLFNSLTFLAFFVVVYGLYWFTPTWAGKKWLLLVSSYLFYAAWSPPYIFLLLLSTVLDWWLARLIDRAEDPSKRRILLFVSLICNLCLLGYFKYGNFLLENFTAFLLMFDIAYKPPESNIILPVGISFYTFASLSYTVDVYRRELRADCRFTDYALFVSFFPHLVAGPIVRASYLLPQIEAPKRPSLDQIGWGLALVVMGLFAKVVVADGILAPVVDRFYAAPASFGPVDAWAAVVSFSGQIYYDFSGYSLCAIGLALCFGFSFPENFRHPYAARGFSDFWRRWHISLSTWLRDYLYIPLGGNRHGKWWTCCALIMTMLIGGLWHGASWLFVLWGGLHGIYLVIEHSMRKISLESIPGIVKKYYLPELLTFVVVTLTWIPFRATSLSNVANVAEQLFVFSDLDNSRVDFLDLFAVIVMLLTLRWHFALRDLNFTGVIARLGPVLQTAVITICLIALFLYSGGDQRAFLYFQF